MAWTEIQERLFKKAELEMDAYSHSMWELPGYAVFDKADEIAAMRFCYNQLVGHIDDWSAEDLEYLLKFQNPLEVIRDQWMAEQSNEASESFGHVLWELRDKCAAEKDYVLDPIWCQQNPQSGPGIC